MWTIIRRICLCQPNDLFALMGTKLICMNAYCDVHKVLGVCFYLHYFSKRYFTKVSKELGIEKHLSSHVARHTFISNLVQHNVPYTEIAKLAGHGTTAMIIKVYAHAIQDEDQTFNFISNLYT